MPESLHSSDRDLIGIEFDETGELGSFVLGPPLLRHDGTLYGGTAIAATVMAMEAATGLEVRWVTTQFVKAAPDGSGIELRTEVLAGGRRTAQVKTTATADGELAFVSLGSSGAHRPDGLAGTFEEMPKVTSFDEAPDSPLRRPGMTEPPERTFSRELEHREAKILSSDPRDAQKMALWAHFADDTPMTPARVAFAADMVPVAVARAAGRAGAGMSLDNSMRFANVAGAEARWVLLEMQGHMASDGYGHGTVRVWSPDGELLAVGGQTANMVYLFD